MIEHFKLEDMTLTDGIYHAKNVSHEELGSSSFDKTSLTYSTFYDGFWHNHRIKCIISAMKAILPPHDERGFVDVGGGGGFNYLVLRFIVKYKYRFYLAQAYCS